MGRLTSPYYSKFVWKKNLLDILSAKSYNIVYEYEYFYWFSVGVFYRACNCRCDHKLHNILLDRKIFRWSRSDSKFGYSFCTCLVSILERELSRWKVSLARNRECLNIIKQTSRKNREMDGVKKWKQRIWQN